MGIYAEAYTVIDKKDYDYRVAQIWKIYEAAINLATDSDQTAFITKTIALAFCKLGNSLAAALEAKAAGQPVPVDTTK